MRQIQLIASATSQEGYKAVTERLNNQVGEFVTFDEALVKMEAKLDREGLDSLRGSGGLR